MAVISAAGQIRKVDDLDGGMDNGHSDTHRSDQDDNIKSPHRGKVNAWTG